MYFAREVRRAGDNWATDAASGGLGFYGKLQRELGHCRHYLTLSEVRSDLFDHIERSHNKLIQRRLDAKDQVSRLSTLQAVETGRTLPIARSPGTSRLHRKHKSPVRGSCGRRRLRWGSYPPAPFTVLAGVSCRACVRSDSLGAMAWTPGAVSCIWSPDTVSALLALGSGKSYGGPSLSSGTAKPISSAFARMAQ